MFAKINVRGWSLLGGLLLDTPAWLEFLLLSFLPHVIQLLQWHAKCFGYIPYERRHILGNGVLNCRIHFILKINVLKPFRNISKIYKNSL